MHFISILNINACGRVHRGSVCSFIVFWLQIASETFALFYHSFSLYVFHCDVSQMR